MKTASNRARKSHSVALAVGVLFAAVASEVLAANLVVNADFESPESIYTGDFSPSVPGDWVGAVGEIVAAENGISPRSGSQMLHFVYASSAPSPYFTVSRVSQIVDVSSAAADVAAGQVVASASAWVNRITGDAETDTLFMIEIAAFDGDPSDLPTRLSGADWLADRQTFFTSDGDPNTWEQESVQLPLPCGTTYVLVRVGAIEDVFNDWDGTEFDGHYTDDVSLELTSDHCKTAGRSVLVLKNKDDDERDRLSWSWRRGEATDKSEFGDPHNFTPHTLCISDAAGSFARFELTTGGEWFDKGARGFKFRDPDGSNAGVTRGALGPGADGKAKIRFVGRGANLALPDLGTLQPPVRVALQNSLADVCWAAEFQTPSVNAGGVWRAVAP